MDDKECDRAAQSFHDFPSAVKLGVSSFLAGAMGEVKKCRPEKLLAEEGNNVRARTDSIISHSAHGSLVQEGAMGRSAGVSAALLDDGRSNAFAKLVQGWEAYINDADEGSTVPFASLQKLHNINLCAPSNTGHYNLQRLTGPLMPTPEDAPLPSHAFRHTHSTPLKYNGPSVFEDEEANFVPGPIPLDPYQRSSSTPSSFRHRSVNSAFKTLTPGSTLNHRASYTSLKAFGSTSRSQSAFDPVRYYTYALDEMERTSIEVVNNIPEPEVEERKSSRGAASRAAKFLADVGVLRRRRRHAHDRMNVVTTVETDVSMVPSMMERQDSSMTAITEQQVEMDVAETSVTVFTEHEPSLNDYSVMSGGSDLSTVLNSLHTMTIDDGSPASDVEKHPLKNLKEVPALHNYQKLYGDEEELEIRRIGPHMRHDAESNEISPLPPYQQMLDDLSSPHSERLNNSIKTQVHLSKTMCQQHAMLPDIVGAATPSPTAMASQCSHSTHSNDSGTTSPCTFNTTSTTQGTCASSRSNPQSGLTTISETDREVMMANRASSVAQKELDALLNPFSILNGYMMLNNNHAPLRDGANVPAEEMFARQGSMLTGSRSVSPLLHHESPPRNIVAHSAGSESVNRPHVMRTLASPIAISPLSFQEGSVQGQSYADGSVEIIKTDSRDDRLTPSPTIGEKENQ
ncbi:hypothetical protein MPSEU_001094800 [Mayamaea pseudoterrestris]|nr:hypothetical protein MPSEU_001094800 [Mayamaea pseudoterrestris]